MEICKKKRLIALFISASLLSLSGSGIYYAQKVKAEPAFSAAVNSERGEMAEEALDSHTGIEAEGSIDIEEEALKESIFSEKEPRVRGSEGMTKIADVSAVVPVTEENFPDEAFRDYLIKNHAVTVSGGGAVIPLIAIKSDNKGGITPVLDEKGNVIPIPLLIDCGNLGISSLKGIELLPTVGSLSASGNKIRDLDISQNTELRYLSCRGNQLAALDISKNPHLAYLDCANNNIGYIDLSNSSALMYLDASGNTLTSIDTSKNPALMGLMVSGNKLSRLDLGGNPELLGMDASYNELSEINLKGCPKLSALNVLSNKLTSLDISKNHCLSSFACTYNAIPLLDFRGNTVLNPFNKDAFNVALQSGTLRIICDPGSPLEKYCEFYLIPYSYSILDERPASSSKDRLQIAVVKEKVDLSLIFKALAGGKEISGYSVSPKECASINRKGILKGKKAGNIVVTAYTGKGGDKQKLLEYPMEIADYSFILKKVVTTSANRAVFAEDYLRCSTDRLCRPDSWLSSNEKIAEIDPVLGKITIKSKGSAKITAMYGKGKYAAKLSFTLKADVPKLSKTELYLKLGKNTTLKLKNTKKKPIWISMDESIVSVGRETGALTGTGPGTTRVVAILDYGTEAQSEFTCKVTVVK